MQRGHLAIPSSICKMHILCRELESHIADYLTKKKHLDYMDCLTGWEKSANGECRCTAAHMSVKIIIDKIYKLLQPYKHQLNLATYCDYCDVPAWCTCSLSMAKVSRPPLKELLLRDCCCRFLQGSVFSLKSRSQIKFSALRDSCSVQLYTCTITTIKLSYVGLQLPALPLAYLPDLPSSKVLLCQNSSCVTCLSTDVASHPGQDFYLCSYYDWSPHLSLTS